MSMTSCAPARRISTPWADAIAIRDAVTDLPGYVPLAGPANKQGRLAADNLCGVHKRYRGTQGSAVLKLFDLTIATTGLNERAARAAGLPFDAVHLYTPSHASYYPGSTGLSLKVLFHTETGRILGAQLVGFEGVDKRCDVLAAAIRHGLTAYDLAELDKALLCPALFLCQGPGEPSRLCHRESFGRQGKAGALANSLPPAGKRAAFGCAYPGGI